jgi:hypothetical protein
MKWFLRRTDTSPRPTAEDELRRLYPEVAKATEIVVERPLGLLRYKGHAVVDTDAPEDTAPHEEYHVGA